MKKTISLLHVKEILASAWHQSRDAAHSIFVAGQWSFFIALSFWLLTQLPDPLPPHFIITKLHFKLVAFIPFLILEMLLDLSILYIAIQSAFDEPIDSSRLIYHVFQPVMILKILGLWVLKIFILAPTLIALISLPKLLTLLFTNTFILHPHYVLGIKWLLDSIACSAFIYLNVRLTIGSAIVLDRGTHPWRAIKMSFEMTQKQFWPLLPMLIISFVVLFVCFGLLDLLIYFLATPHIQYDSLLLIIYSLVILCLGSLMPFLYVLRAMIYKHLSIALDE